MSSSNVPRTSSKVQAMPASAIRKLVPFSEAAEASGVKVYHLNVGAPDIKSPDCAIDAVIKKCESPSVTMFHTVLKELLKQAVYSYFSVRCYSK